MLYFLPRMRTTLFRTVLFALGLSLCFSMWQTPVPAEEKEKSTKDLERINNEMRQKKEQLKRAKRKERSVLSELDNIDKKIQAGSVELHDQQKRLREAEGGLREIERSSAQITAKLDRMRPVYGQRLRAYYKMSRSGESAILAADNLDDALRRTTYLRVIAEHDQSLMREYGKSLERLAARQAEIALIRDDVLSRRRTIETKKAGLEEQKKKKAEILADVRKEKGLYEQTVRELEEASASLWSMIKRAEQEKKAKATASAPSTFHSDRSRLPWPIEGKVLTRFGMQKHPQFGTMVFRRGIEIEAHTGDPVKAVNEGEVAFADWHKGYGNLIILDHGNSFYTLYGNLLKLDIKKGDRVSKGQVIGLAGDTGSVKGTKLYFEVRQNGEARDPLAWLGKK